MEIRFFIPAVSNEPQGDEFLLTEDELNYIVQEDGSKIILEEVP